MNKNIEIINNKVNEENIKNDISGQIEKDNKKIINKKKLETDIKTYNNLIKKENDNNKEKINHKTEKIKEKIKGNNR